MQFFGQTKPPVGIVFDSDFGNRIDTALALSLLYGLDGKNEARVVSVSVTKSSLKAAAFCEVVGRFYSGAVSGAFNAPGRTLPMGMAVDGKMAEDFPLFTVPLGRRNDKGEPVYTHGIHKLTDTAEVSALIRNAFTAQHDQNAIAVLAGPATNMVRALALPGVKDLIARKVRFLAVSAGAFPEGGPESHVKADIAAAKILFAEWPTPVVVAGQELGSQLLYPAESIERDFAWSPAHPVVDAYRANRAMPYDAPTWDMAAVLYAVRAKDDYFALSDPGTVEVLDDGRTRFKPSSEGKHRYLILDPAQKDRILRTYVELASAKPVIRQPRFRRQQQQQQDQKQDPKPPEAKK